MPQPQQYLESNIWARIYKVW